VQPAANGLISKQIVFPLLRFPRFFAECPLTNRRRAPRQAGEARGLGKFKAALGQLVHVWDINGLPPGNPPRLKTQLPRFCCPVTTSGQAPGMACFLPAMGGPDQWRQSGPIMFTQETAALAFAPTLPTARAVPVSRAFFMSTKYDSAVKIPSKSNVQHL
jgi:hypothetical protein